MGDFETFFFGYAVSQNCAILRRIYCIHLRRRGEYMDFLLQEAGVLFQLVSGHLLLWDLLFAVIIVFF